MKRSRSVILILGFVAFVITAIALPLEAQARAYLFAHDASSPLGEPYTPDLSYSFNNQHDRNSFCRLGLDYCPITVTRTATGKYTVVYFSGVDRVDVQVVAYGDDNRRCKINAEETYYPGLP